MCLTRYGLQAALFLCVTGAAFGQDRPSGGQPPIATFIGSEDATERERAEQAWRGKPSIEQLRNLRRAAWKESRKLQGRRLEVPSHALPYATSPWRSLGPALMNNGPAGSIGTSTQLPFSGLIRALAIPGDQTVTPSGSFTIYALTRGGGLWKADANTSPDKTARWTWVPLTDNLPVMGPSSSLDGGALALDFDASNRIYLGTTGGFDANDLPDEGSALWISPDAGATWTPGPALPGASSIASILSLKGGVLLVGTNAGLFRSPDQGASFSGITLPGLDRPMIHSLAAINGKIILGAQEQNPDYAPWGYFLRPGHLYQSADFGVTWREIILPPITVGSDHRPGRITVAGNYSGTVVGRAYAIAQELVPETSLPGYYSGQQMMMGLFTSTDGGSTWTYRPSPNIFGGYGAQALYNQALAVSAVNDNWVAAGANVLSYSLDGGSSWRNPITPEQDFHPDTHAALWIGGSGGMNPRLFFGTDGGLHFLPNPLLSTPTPHDSSWLDSKPNIGLVTSLLYSIGSTTAPTPADSRDYILLGTQDNAATHRSAFRASMTTSTDYDNAPYWGNIGDVTSVLVHALDGNRAIITASGALSFTQNRFMTRALNTAPTGLSFNFYHKLIPDLSDPLGNRVFTWAYGTILRTNDFGQAWAPAFTPPPVDFRALAVDPRNANKIWTVAEPSTGYLTTNGGSNWFPKALPTSLAWDLFHTWSHTWIDPLNSSRFYLAASSYGQGLSHLWRSDTNGDAWQALDGGGASDNGFPFGVPVYKVETDRTATNQVYAATELGLYASGDAGATWARLGSNLPLLPVWDFYLAPDGSFIRIATYGRGAWQLDNPGTGLLPGRILSVTPGSPVLLTGQVQVFSATLSGAPTPAAWRVLESDSLIGRDTGSFRAPVNPGTFIVKASLASDPGVTGSTVVTVVSAPSLNITPGTSRLAPGQSRNFTATLIPAVGSAVWSMIESGGGSIDGSGRYTAPSTPGTYHVRASWSGGAAATAQATVNVGFDLNGDTNVDLDDFALLAHASGGTNLNFDLNGDGRVDDLDLALLRTALGMTP